MAEESARRLRLPWSRRPRHAETLTPPSPASAVRVLFGLGRFGLGFFGRRLSLTSVVLQGSAPGGRAPPQGPATRARRVRVPPGGSSRPGRMWPPPPRRSGGRGRCRRRRARRRPSTPRSVEHRPERLAPAAGRRTAAPRGPTEAGQLGARRRRELVRAHRPPVERRQQLVDAGERLRRRQVVVGDVVVDGDAEPSHSSTSSRPERRSVSARCPGPGTGRSGPRRSRPACRRGRRRHRDGVTGGRAGSPRWRAGPAPVLPAGVVLVPAGPAGGALAAVQVARRPGRGAGRRRRCRTGQLEVHRGPR